MISAKGGIQMLNNEVILSIMKTYDITKARVKESNDSFDLIICEMNDSISLQRWNLLESVLKDLSQKKVNILTYHQAKRYLGDSYINESKVIQ